MLYGNLDLPEKMKIFMWRAANNLLQTTYNMWKMTVVPAPICQKCKQGMETITHALIECKATQKIWQHSLLGGLETPSTPGWNVLDVLLNTLKKLSKGEAKLQIAYWWAMWYARIHFIFKGKKLDPLIQATKAEAAMKAIQKNQKIRTIKKGEKRSGETKAMTSPSQHLVQSKCGCNH